MVNTEAEFRANWSTSVGRGAGPDRWADSLVARHRQPWRRYHTLIHVVWVLRHARTLTSAAPTPGSDESGLVIAACFHDAVYDPHAAPGLNELNSARLATEALGELGWDDDRSANVARLIKTTATHESDGSADGDVLIAADLAILAAQPNAYSDYVRQIRAEFHFVDEAGWREGRLGVLRNWLERPTLFPPELMARSDLVRKWDTRARANISAEAAALLSGDE